MISPIQQNHAPETVSVGSLAHGCFYGIGRGGLFWLRNSLGEQPTRFLNSREKAKASSNPRELATTATCLSSYSAYKPVTFDEESGTLSPADADLDQGLILTDGGFDFYSPQTFVDGKGRRLLFAWMSRMEEAEEQAFAAGEPSVHCLTIPRVLHWREGRLWQTPPEELYSLLGEPIRPSELSGRAFWLDIRPTAGDEPFRLTFHGGEADLEFDPAARTLTFTRTGWLTGRPESKTCPLDHLDRLEIWSDSSSLELFINGGSTVLSSRIYPTSETLGLDVRGVDGCGITLRPIRTI